MRMIEPTPDKPAMAQLGELIRRARVSRDLTHRDVAQQVGVDKERVAQWEAGENVPRGREWPRLRGMMNLLDAARLVWQAAINEAESRAATAPEVKREEEQIAKEVSGTNGNVPDVPALPDPRVQTSFGAALRVARLNLGFTQDELGQLIDISGSTISCWETGTIPVLDNWNRLVDALPELKDCAPPGVRDINRPGRPMGPLAFPTPTSMQLAAPRVTQATPPQGVPVVPQPVPPLPQPPSPMATYARPEPERKFVSPTPTDPIDLAGIEYARALREKAKAQLAALEAADRLKRAEAALQLAQERLQGLIKS